MTKCDAFEFLEPRHCGN